MAELASLIVEVTPKGIEAARAQLDALSAAGKKADDSSKDLAKSIAGWSVAANLATSVGIKLIGGIKDMAVESVKLAASFETAKVQWGVLVGDMAVGEAVFQNLQSFAAQTPLAFEGINTAAQTLKGFGVATDDLVPTLSKLGDIAMGDSTKLQSLSLVYGQVMAQGVAKTQDLYQFVNAGVPIFQLLGKTMNVSAGEVKNLASEGKIGFKEISDAIKDATSEGGQFFDMMDKTAETAEGKWSTAMDNLAQAKARAGKGVLDSLSGALDEFNKDADRGGKVASATDGFTAKTVSSIDASIKSVRELLSMAKTDRAKFKEYMDIPFDFLIDSTVSQYDQVLKVLEQRRVGLMEIEKRANAAQTFADLRADPAPTPKEDKAPLTDNQKKVIEVQKELRAAFAAADQNYDWFKDTAEAYDVLGAKAKATESAIQELFGEGFSLNGAEVQPTIKLANDLGLSVDDMNRALGRAQDVDLSSMPLFQSASFGFTNLLDPDKAIGWSNSLEAGVASMLSFTNSPDYDKWLAAFGSGEKTPEAKPIKTITAASSGDFSSALLSTPKNALNSILNPNIEQSQNNLEKFKQTLEDINDLFANMAEQAFVESFKSIGAAIYDADAGGKAFAESMADIGMAILDQLPLLLLQAGLQALAVNWVLGLGLIAASGIVAIGGGYINAAVSEKESSSTEDNALGGVYSSRSLSSYSGDVYASPQLFNFAKGAAVGRFGEAGPEGILPLARTSSGALGVQSVGSGSTTSVIVNNNGSNTQATAEETTSADGSKQVIVTIENVMKQALASGKLDSAMSRFGARPQGVRRHS